MEATIVNTGRYPMHYPHGRLVRGPPRRFADHAQPVQVIFVLADDNGRPVPVKQCVASLNALTASW